MQQTKIAIWFDCGCKTLDKEQPGHVEKDGCSKTSSWIYATIALHCYLLWITNALQCTPPPYLFHIPKQLGTLLSFSHLNYPLVPTYSPYSRDREKARMMKLKNTRNSYWYRPVRRNRTAILPSFPIPAHRQMNWFWTSPDCTGEMVGGGSWFFSH